MWVALSPLASINQTNKIMYAIIDTTTKFIANKTEHHYFVKNAKFTEIGWQTKRTRIPHEAKKYKTYQRAYNAAKQMGCQYEVVEV